MKKVAEAAAAIQPLPKYPHRYYSFTDTMTTTMPLSCHIGMISEFIPISCMRSSSCAALLMTTREMGSVGPGLIRSRITAHLQAMVLNHRMIWVSKCEQNSFEAKALKQKVIKNSGRYGNWRLRAIPTGKWDWVDRYFDWHIGGGGFLQLHASNHW